MLRGEVENCALPMWYKHFRPITFETFFVQLPPDFLAYLQSDGIIIPPSLLPNQPQDDTSRMFGDDDDDDDDDWGEPPQAVQPNFPELENRIKNAIDKLGGEVFIKLNWSAPRDASWILCDGSLCCRAPLDVLLLLKGSEFIQHDLTQAFVECSDHVSDIPTGGFVLCLRRWENILPAGEFRCFVRNHQLIGVSQRNFREFYPSVVGDRINILNDIQQFFFRYIQYKHPNAEYVFDVYRASSQHVLLVDFNPFSKVTDPLLYTWDELTSPAFNLHLRVVESESSIKSHPYASSRVPQDIMTINSQQDINDFVSMFNSNNLAEPHG